MRKPLAAGRRIVHGAILPLTVAGMLASAPLGAETRNYATLGYDSFIDRFTILEADTFELVQEYYAGLGNALYYRNAATKTKAGVSNVFRFGSQTVDESLDAEATLARAKSTLVDLRGGFHWKHYQEGSDYAFGNDYLQANSLFKIRQRIGEYSRVTLRSRFETVDYEKKTDFDYDYRYLDGGVEIEAGPDFGTMALLGLTLGSREVRDTTALSYDRVLVELEARIGPAGGTSLRVSSVGDRKGYREKVRSSLWAVFSSLDASCGTPGGTVYSARVESELAIFDRPDTTYFDTQFLRGGVRMRRPVSDGYAVSVEPRVAKMFCPGFVEERYWEYSCVIEADIMHNDRLWLSLSYEPGYRNYTLAENELYSDFYLNRITAMGSLSLPSTMAFNLFLTHEPERHSRRTDDFSVTLLSVDLTKRF